MGFTSDKEVEAGLYGIFWSNVDSSEIVENQMEQWKLRDGK